MSETLPEPPTLVLASASPRRRELLAQAGVAFIPRAADGLNEEDFSGSSRDLCRTLAIAKAEWVRDRSEEALPVLGSDTVVAIDAEAVGVANGHAAEGKYEDELVLGKPRDDAHAIEMLSRLSGRRHRVASGIAIAQKGRATRSAVEVSEVTFRRLSRAEIEAYVASGDPAGKAGSYGIQSGGRALVESFRGCYYNIVGLPMTALRTLLAPETLNWTCDCLSHPLSDGSKPCGS